MIEFKYNHKKTIEAAALFLKLHGVPMEYMKLLKLLYMADRMTLDKMDESITGDKYVSMKYGPVLSKVYDQIIDGPHQENEENNLWSKYISSPSEYLVKLLEDPGVGELCEEEEEIIERVYELYGKMDVFKLANLTHDLCPEWTDPNTKSLKSLPISIEEILKHLNKTEEDISYIQENVAKDETLDALFK